ncbi:MAG: DUF305 domain-containing protein [Caulobacterales bacterium 32-69-10]|nr:MAG: DUF305 domain-containing protein [Caulobacterales bacterium 32-69-10]
MDHQSPTMQRKHYGKLALMIVLSFVSMYILMYAMVDKATNIHPSLNQAYMAGLMTAPMVVIELLLMSMMYPRRGLNLAILAVSVVVGLGCFIAIRQQFLIGDREFLRSMIPHHSGAILMCGKAPIKEPELKRLCASIIQGQQAEIDQMNAMLNR